MPVGVAHGLGPVAGADLRQHVVDVTLHRPDVAVLTGWVVGGLLVSSWCFQWDPHRPAHARPAEARTTARSA